jgi:hypothetical protein
MSNRIASPTIHNALGVYERLFCVDLSVKQATDCDQNASPTLKSNQPCAIHPVTHRLWESENNL